MPACLLHTQTAAAYLPACLLADSGGPAAVVSAAPTPCGCVRLCTCLACRRNFCFHESWTTAVQGSWQQKVQQALQQLRANGHCLELLVEELRVRACACACMTGLRAPLSCERPGRVRGGWTLCGVAVKMARRVGTLSFHNAHAQGRTPPCTHYLYFLGLQFGKMVNLLGCKPFHLC